MTCASCCSATTRRSRPEPPRRQRPGLDASYVRPWNTGRQLARQSTPSTRRCARSGRTARTARASSRTTTRSWPSTCATSMPTSTASAGDTSELRPLRGHRRAVQRRAGSWTSPAGRSAGSATPTSIRDAGCAEYSRGASWANDAGLKRVLADLPAFEALAPYLHFYTAVAEAEYRVSEWPRHPLLRD